jgi:hypothetical protein
MRIKTKADIKRDASRGRAAQAPADGATPTSHLLEGDPAQPRLMARRDEARACRDEGWRPPQPSRATRTWGLKSSGSMRALLASIGDSLIGCESGQEWKTAVISAAHPRIVAIREQAEAVEYVDGGATRRHVPDFVVDTTEQRREALIVKPDRWGAGAARLAATLESQRAGGIDAFHHVGDTQTVRSVVQAADLIGVVRRDGPASDHPEVVRLRAAIDRAMTIEEVVAGSEDPGTSFRAVVRLIADGHVRVVDGWSIAHEKTVEPCASRDREVRS